MYHNVYHNIYTAICPDISYPNGMVVYNPSTTPRLEGTTATHTCNIEYRPRSIETVFVRTCQSHGQWDISDRICVGTLLLIGIVLLYTSVYSYMHASIYRCSVVSVVCCLQQSSVAILPMLVMRWSVLLGQHLEGRPLTPATLVTNCQDLLQ